MSACQKRRFEHVVQNCSSLQPPQVLRGRPAGSLENQGVVASYAPLDAAPIILIGLEAPEVFRGLTTVGSHFQMVVEKWRFGNWPTAL